MSSNEIEDPESFRQYQSPVYEALLKFKQSEVSFHEKQQKKDTSSVSDTSFDWRLEERKINLKQKLR